jgi:hypothetical protein
MAEVALISGVTMVIPILLGGPAGAGLTQEA